jgi:hypothetical protein
MDSWRAPAAPRSGTEEPGPGAAVTDAGRANYLACIGRWYSLLAHK